MQPCAEREGAWPYVPGEITWPSVEQGETQLSAGGIRPSADRLRRSLPSERGETQPSVEEDETQPSVEMEGAWPFVDG